MRDLRGHAPPALVRAFAKVFGTVKVRSLVLEALLGMSVNDSAARSIEIGLAESTCQWGALYRWRLERFLFLRSLQRGDGEALAARVARADATCYDALEALPHCGVVMALPHYGHFAHSVIGIAQYFLCRARRVLVFYESPGKHASNALFDEIGVRLFGGSNLFQVIHNDRRGLLAASRALRAGDVVVIMPDAYAAEQETYRVPFGCGSRSAALGTAFLARRAGAVIVPCLSVPEPARFRTVFAKPINASGSIANGLAIEEGLQRDYAATAQLFAALYDLMDRNFVPWQYISSHFAACQALHDLDVGRAEAITDLLELEIRGLSVIDYA